MKSPLNTSLDDLATEIGFTATCTLVAWFGGRNLWVPVEAKAEHVLAKLLGLPALRRLVAMSPSRAIAIPKSPLLYQMMVKRDMAIVEMCQRMPPDEVADVCGLTLRRVLQITKAYGAVDEALLEIAFRETPPEFRLRKPPQEGPPIVSYETGDLVGATVVPGSSAVAPSGPLRDAPLMASAAAKGRRVRRRKSHLKRQR